LQNAQEVLDRELAALIDRDLKGLQTVAKEFNLEMSDDKDTLVKRITDFFNEMNSEEKSFDSKSRMTLNCN